MSDDGSGISLPPGRLTPLPIDPDSVTLSGAATASIGKKYAMAWCGLFWCFFLLVHLVGNLFFFAGKEALNDYSAKLMKLGPILIASEIGLVFFLLLHTVFGIAVTIGNWKARPVRYEVDRAKGGRGVASSTMIYTGALILVFIVVHLVQLKFGEHGTHEGKPDLWQASVDLFQDPVRVIGYVIAVALVGLHVSHALKSSLRTIGLHHEKYTPRIDITSRVFGIVVFVGYGAIPVLAYAGRLNP